MGARLLFAWLFLASCGAPSSGGGPSSGVARSSGDAPANNRPVDSSEQTCDERAARVERRLQETPDRPQFLVPEDLDLPRTSAAGVAAQTGIDVVVPVQDPLYFDGREIGAREVGGACETLREVARERGLSLTLHVWADRRVPFERLRPLLAGCVDRALLLALGDEAPDPCPPSLGERCDRLSGIGLPTNTDAEGDAWVFAIGECDALVGSLTRLVELVPDERNGHIRRSVPAALRECGCAGVDADAIEFLAVRSLRAHAPDVRAFEPDPNSIDPRVLVGDWIDARR